MIQVHNVWYLVNLTSLPDIIFRLLLPACIYALIYDCCKVLVSETSLAPVNPLLHSISLTVEVLIYHQEHDLKEGMLAPSYRRHIEDTVQILRKALKKSLKLLKSDPQGCLISPAELDDFPTNVIRIIARLGEEITRDEGKRAGIIDDDVYRSLKPDARFRADMHPPPPKANIRLAVKTCMICVECGVADVLFDAGRDKRYKISGCCKIVGVSEANLSRKGV